LFFFFSFLFLFFYSQTRIVNQCRCQGSFDTLIIELYLFETLQIPIRFLQEISASSIIPRSEFLQAQ